MDDPEIIGPIAYLQLQREQLVIGTQPNRVYRTEPLIAVDTLVLTPDGPLARIDGGWVVSRHHRAHPANVQPNPMRAVSVGFTGHYERIEERFGWGPLGVGGENVIVETPRRIMPDDVGGGLVIRTRAGDIDLKSPQVAAPCVPFTRHLLRRRDAPLDDVAEPRAFLQQGMRGYVAALDHLPGPIEVSLGDTVLRRG